MALNVLSIRKRKI